jgi:3-oxoacyl-[acyl-carrier protein] reductase
MNLSLSGKKALVCGASQGIGLAIAQELALLGAHCILMARNAARLQTALSTLDATQDQVHAYLVADFSNNEEVLQVITDFVKNESVAILINNTGGPAAGPIVQAKSEDFIAAYQLHLINNHQITQAVLPAMRKNAYGRIINIISTSVKAPLPNLGVSNTTRAAVAGWAKTLANEVAKDNITVNNVLPGATETVRLKNIIDNKAAKNNLATDAVRDEMLHEIPMGRFGTATEIGSLAAFLATPAAAYITGQSICVDGGRTGNLA